MRGSEYPGSEEILGTALSLLAKHLCGRWQQKGPGVQEPGRLHPRLGTTEIWGAEEWPSQGILEEEDRWSPEE